VPILIQVCILVATLALVAAAVALIPLLAQVRRTAAQVERTMLRLDGAIPTVVQAVDEARGVLDTLNQVASRADRITSDFEHVGGKAAKLSTLLVDQVLAPASQVAAIVSGVRMGASFLLDGWLKRRRSTTPSTGGNHDE
jgi:uncharacterized protein YoxC